MKKFTQVNLCNILYSKKRYSECLNCLNKIKPYFIENESDMIRKEFYRYYLKAIYRNKVRDNLLDNYFEMTDSMENDRVKFSVINAELDFQKRALNDSLKIISIEQQLTNSEMQKQKMWKWISFFGMLLSIIIIFITRRLFTEEKKNKNLLQEKYNYLKEINQKLQNDIENHKNKELSLEKLLNSFLELDNKQKTKIKLKDIVLLESKNRKVYILTKYDEIFESWQPLKSYYDLLPKDLFIQVHRSYIINTYHIKSKIKDKIVLTNNQTIKISRNRKEEIEKILSKNHTI